jgi:CrcB protein
MPLVLAVALGGALGAVSRYGLDRAIESRSSSSFPWATLAVNVSGCLLVGFLIAAVVDRHDAPAWVRAGMIVGFCGGYTTFSTFAQETLDLAEGRATGLAVANAVLSFALGIAAVAVGTRLGRAA